MFVWDAAMIAFLKDAAEYGGFYEAIAGHILPHLPQNANVCDAGCGLGYLSLALARGTKSVVAVDASAAALSVLKENVQKRGVQNIRVIEGDVFSALPATPYDAMVFCFFGSVEEILRTVRSQCAGKAFLIKKNWASHRFRAGEQPLKKFTYERTCEELRKRGIPYASETFSLDMGQPFRTMEDADAFFRLYARDGEAVAPADRRERLRPTNDPVYPWYLPSPGSLGMIVLDAGSIPPDIEKA